MFMEPLSPKIFMVEYLHTGLTGLVGLVHLNMGSAWEWLSFKMFQFQNRETRNNLFQLTGSYLDINGNWACKLNQNQ